MLSKNLLYSVVAAALYIWDYFITFDMEIDLIWRSKWNFMTGLFLVQRYLPFADTVWLVLFREPSHPSFIIFSLMLFWQKKWDETCPSRTASRYIMHWDVRLDSLKTHGESTDLKCRDDVAGNSSM